MRGTVLCVDNDRDLVQILSKALEGEGYRVQSAYDGDRAVAMVAQEPPDLVLLDLILPRRDGFAVLEAVRGMDGPAAATPVVLITGCSPSPGYRNRANSLGAAGVLHKPVPLDKLLDVVAGQVEKRRPGSARVREAQRDDPKLSGSLATLPFPALLHHLHGLRATGILSLNRGKRRKWIEMREGYPVSVRSNLVNECLGNFLVRTGRISKSALEESVRRMRGGKLQGEILVAMQVLRENEIAGALRAQAEEKLFEIFSWKQGSYRFERGGGLQRANELALDTSPANLILRGTRQRMPIDRIDAFLRASSDASVAPGESQFYRFQDMDLDPSHRELLEGLDGSRLLSEFLTASEDLRRTVYGLLSVGLLELRGGQSPGVAGPARPRTRAPEPRREDPKLAAELTATAERMRGQDHFALLGVGPSASDQEICAAYERLSGFAHPDRVAGASQAVKRLAAEINARVAEAYETLSDPRRRAEYLMAQRREEREAAEQAETRAALDAEIEFQRGQTSLKQRDYSAALRYFRRALDLYPEEGEYHGHYGWALHLCHPEDARKLREAFGHVRKGIKLARHSDKLYLYMGRLCKADGREEAAERMFTRAVQLQPECVEALRELRLIHMRREKSKGLVRRLLRR